MTIISKRIQEALALRDMNQAELAIKALISKSSVSSYIKGTYIPKGKNLQRMAKVLNVSEDWLAGKDVPMAADAPKITNEMLKFALFNGEEGVTDKMLQEVKEFANYIKQKNS